MSPECLKMGGVDILRSPLNAPTYLTYFRLIGLGERKYPLLRKNCIYLHPNPGSCGTLSVGRGFLRIGCPARTLDLGQTLRTQVGSALDCHQ